VALCAFGSDRSVITAASDKSASSPALFCYLISIKSKIEQDSQDSALLSLGPKSALQKIRGLTRRKHPNEFVPELQRLCAACGVALAHYAGMRVGDIVAVEWSGWDGEYLAFRQSKTGQLVNIRAPKPLREELLNAPREGTHILVNDQAQPYTRDGLQTNLWKLVKRLVGAGLVQPGLCFHGLRHSLGAALYDLGLDREARKAALGHASDAASMVYERGGNRRAASDRAFAAFDAHLATNADKTKNAK
jgi:integrase